LNENPIKIDSLWDFGAVAESEARFREILDGARKHEDQSYLVELLTQIGRAQGLQANFDAAHATLDEAESLLESNMQRARVRLFLERGRTFNSSKKQEEALPLFQKALELALAENEEFLSVDAAHMLGIAAPLDKRIEWNKRALEMAQASEDERAQGWVGSLYNNLGYYYMEDGHYARALDYFELLLAHTQEKGDEDFANVAGWFIAKVHRLTENYEEALKGQIDLLKKNAQAAKSDAYVFEELGEIYLALGNAEKRANFFQLAYDAFTTDERYVYEVKFEQERLSRILELAEIE
jgi:tetratricopeptide (TPR) repeat protein